MGGDERYLYRVAMRARTTELQLDTTIMLPSLADLRNTKRPSAMTS